MAEKERLPRNALNLYLEGKSLLQYQSDYKVKQVEITADVHLYYSSMIIIFMYTFCYNEFHFGVESLEKVEKRKKYGNIGKK